MDFDILGDHLKNSVSPNLMTTLTKILLIVDRRIALAVSSAHEAVLVRVVVAAQDDRDHLPGLLTAPT